MKKPTAQSPVWAGSNLAAGKGVSFIAAEKLGIIKQVHKMYVRGKRLPLKEKINPC